MVTPMQVNGAPVSDKEKESLSSTRCGDILVILKKMRFQVLESISIVSRLEQSGVLVYEGNFFKGQQHGTGTAYSIVHGSVESLKGNWSQGQYIG